MGLYPFLLLLSLVIASSASQFDITQLDEMQALRFEEIGKLKLIKSYRAIKFQVNIGTIIQQIANATEHFELVKNMFQNDSNTQNKLDNIEMVMNLKKMEFRDVIYGMVENKGDEHLRKKRFFMSSEHGQLIQNDINNLNSKTEEIVNGVNGLMNRANYTMIIMNKSIDENSRKSAMLSLLEQKGDVERIVNGISKMFTERKLNSEIISIEELNNQIKEVKDKLNNDEELPYEKLIYYYRDLLMNYTIEENKFIEVEVNIPIIEKIPRKLYKIVEIPARYGSKLIMTDVIWKYIAENDNETVVFMSLQVCLKSQENKIEYYCKIQSPIKNKHAEDCLNNALFGSKMINLDLCKYSAAQPKGLMFIRLNEGEYFYYTPKNENLTVTCVTKTINEILAAQTSGIIKLEPGCIAMTSTHKLITTVRYGPIGYRTINVVRVFFDVDKLKENIKKYNAPYVDNYYIENVGLLREMSKPMKNIEKPEPVNFAVTKFELLEYLTIIASSIIIVYVVYNAWKWRSKNREEDPKLSKMSIEAPIEYYVVKE